MDVRTIGLLESGHSWQRAPNTVYFLSVTSGSERVSIYGESIAKMHDWHRKFFEVFCSDKSLDLPTDLCLEVARDHVFRDGEGWDGMLFHVPDCFFYQLCLVCVGKMGNDLLDHSALAHEGKVVSCDGVYLITR